MDAKDRLNAGIADLRSLVATGDLPGAQNLATALVADGDLRRVGPQTALGLPRRLHAALLHLAKAEGDAVRRAGYQFLLVPPADLLTPLFHYSADEKHDITVANRQAVPRVIHQIWIGRLPVPAACAAWEAHAAAQGYGYRLWREAELDDLGLTDNPVYAAMRERGDFPGAVDVARYAILAAKGGIYLDCDWYPARSDIGFHDLLPLIGLTAIAEDIPRQTGQGGLLLGNYFIATPPDHPALNRLNAALAASLSALPKAPAWWSTGPLVFTLAARGGAVSIAPHDMIAATLPPGTPFGEVQKLLDRAQSADLGLLIGWKSW